MAVRFDCYRFGVDVFCKHSVWISTNAFSGVYPRPPPFLRDDGDGLSCMQYNISVENQPYPVLCTLSPDGCTAHVPDFPKITTQAATLEAALLEVKQQIQKALRQYKNPPIPTKQEQIVVPTNSVLVLVKAG